MFNSSRILPCSTLFIILLLAIQPVSHASEKEQGIVNVILQAIPRPDPGQFSQAEQVVKHLLQCVKDRNFDDALTCFPIHEHYEKNTFEVSVESLEVFSFINSPIPEASFHNLSLALRYGGIYDRLTAGLLGMDAARMMVVGSGRETDAVSPGELKKKLDFSKLKDLSVGRIEVTNQLPKERISGLHKALGVEALCIVTAEVKLPGGKSEEPEFIVGKIKDNWQILSSW